MIRLLLLLLALTGVAHAQLYPVVNFRWHDGYIHYDPYSTLLHADGLGSFPELDQVSAIQFASLWFLQSNGPITCNGTCGDARFTGCNLGQYPTTWPPPLVGTPVQDSGGGIAGAYLRLRSSRAFTFAGTTTYCGHAGGYPGQKVEVCDQASGATDSGQPYFIQSQFGELRSFIGYAGGGVTPASFYVEQWGTQANYQLYPSVAFWLTGTGHNVVSSVYLQAFTDGTARWSGMWSVNYVTLGCRLDFPVQAIAVGQP